MRAGVRSPEIAEELEGLTREVLPFAAPVMNYLHGRLLAHSVEQDMIGHMEADIDEEALEEGRLRVAIAFADLAGYARLTVEQGDEAVVSTVERFVRAVGERLPVDARVIKTLGDEVMVVGSDPVALTEWAVQLQAGLAVGEPAPPIGIHYGEALYRDGDYFGREVNQAARVVARAGGGEVLVTRSVVDNAVGLDGLQFDLIGEVRLKGFSEATELSLPAPGDPCPWAREPPRCGAPSRAVRAGSASGPSGWAAGPARAVGGDALRGPRLDLSARPRRRAAPRWRRARAARQLRPARAGRRRGGPLRGAVRAPGGGA